MWLLIEEAFSQTLTLYVFSLILINDSSLMSFHLILKQ